MKKKVLKLIKLSNKALSWDDETEEEVQQKNRKYQRKTALRKKRIIIYNICRGGGHKD